MVPHHDREGLLCGRGQQGERNHRKTDDGTCEILQKHYDLPGLCGRTEHRIRKENGMSGTMKFTDSPEQAAVVQAPSYADVVVVAGAGSGKTYTMTRRIITLIEQG